MTFILRFLALALLASHAAAFHPGVARPCFGVRKAAPVATTSRSPTFLKYTVIPGIEEDEPPKAKAEPAPVVQTHDANGGPGSLESYRDIDDAEADKEMNVDAYSNSVSGGVIPGVQLTALCGDD